MQFTIRPYRPADFRTLCAIDQSCFAPGISYSPAELMAYIGRPQAFTLVAEADDVESGSAVAAKPGESPEIAGFVVAERGRSSGHIITIDVRSEARRHGIGSRLLRGAEDQLRRRSCSRIRLETAVDNRDALFFYKRHGYTVVRTVPRYYSNGVDALLLEKHLLSAVASR